MKTGKILECTHLTMRYGTGNALQDVSFSVPEGTITGVIGANGCGKTTLFKIIAGLIQDYGGEVRICGCEDTWNTKRDICYHATFPYYEPGMTIGRALRQHAVLYTGFDKKIAEGMFRRFGFELSVQLGQLSRGRCALALLILSLSVDAKIYLFDEPFGGIDVRSRAEMKEIMMDTAARGKTLLIATHEILDFEPLFDDVLLIRGGNVVLSGSADDLREEYGRPIVEIAKELI